MQQPEKQAVPPAACYAQARKRGHARAARSAAEEQRRTDGAARQQAIRKAKTAP